MNKVYAWLVCCMILLLGCSSAQKMLVKSDPSGADVYINGEKVGKTPAALKVTFSENCQRVVEKKILSVKLAGYKEKKEVISQENMSNKTFEFVLAPEIAKETGSTVASKPSVTAVRESDVAAVVSSPSTTMVMENEAAPTDDSKQSVTTMQEDMTSAGKDREAH